MAIRELKVCLLGVSPAPPSAGDTHVHAPPLPPRPPRPCAPSSQPGGGRVRACPGACHSFAQPPRLPGSARAPRRSGRAAGPSAGPGSAAAAPGRRRRAPSGLRGLSPSPLIISFRRKLLSCSAKAPDPFFPRGAVGFFTFFGGGRGGVGKKAQPRASQREGVPRLEGEGVSTGELSSSETSVLRRKKAA